MHTEIACGACGQPVLVTITSSLTKSDGTPWRVFHGACYKPMKEKRMSVECMECKREREPMDEDYSPMQETQKQLLATYGGTGIETICRELSAVDDPGVDPDFRPQALNGLPWWTMKIRKALKYRPLLEKAWEEGHHAGQHNEHEHRPRRVMTNPYRQETDA